MFQKSLEQHSADVIVGGAGDRAKAGRNIPHIQNTQERENKRFLELDDGGFRDHYVAAGELFHPFYEKLVVGSTAGNQQAPAGGGYSL